MARKKIRGTKKATAKDLAPGKHKGLTPAQADEANTKLAKVHKAGDSTSKQVEPAPRAKAQVKRPRTKKGRRVVAKGEPVETSQKRATYGEAMAFLKAKKNQKAYPNWKTILGHLEELDKGLEDMAQRKLRKKIRKLGFYLSNF